MINEMLKECLDSVENDIDMLVEPQKFSNREDMGEMFRDFLGYDPTRYWDQEIMSEQMSKLLETNPDAMTLDDREEAIEVALDHFDAIKPNVMLQVAQKTIKSMFDKDFTTDDLGLDLEYLMNSEIFGNGYDEFDDDEDDSSLLDELNDEDDIDTDDDEDEFVD